MRIKGKNEMAINNALLALRVPKDLLDNLKDMYPDTDMRNNVIRAALKKIVERQLVIKTYELEIRPSA